MKRYIAICLLSVCVLFGLTGCTKVVSERYEVTTAVVTYADYTPARTEIITNGKRAYKEYYPASGYVKLVCKGRIEYLQGASFYERFHEHIGDEVWAVNRIRVYDNDNVKERVVNLFEDRDQAERVCEAQNG